MARVGLLSLEPTGRPPRHRTTTYEHEEDDVTELRLMAVHAHPDDESSKGAATCARYADEGHRVLVVTLTGGERGDILNPSMDLPEVRGRIADVRRDEMARAAEILGVEHTWLGFVDSGLPQGDPLPPLPDGCFAVVPLEEPVAELVKLIREFRPHVMTTYDENGGYPHPDHIRCHQVSVAAFEAASGRPVPYNIAPRRAGDIASSYASVEFAAKELGWKATRDLKQMCESSWKFQQSATS